jgi:asparagine synthase (glutamine-hydrolysing)
MCGITGFVDFSKNTPASVLKQMTDSMVHRGPDGEGQWLEEKQNYSIGLGHRRLSIIDLNEHAAQPMHFKHLHLTFNGEIYNYQEIKAELTKLGHEFKTQSDTEVILHAYTEWAEKCVDRFVGMFAIVIYDEAKDELFCIRDRAGVKPFFYSFQNNNILFGSELKSLTTHSAFEKKLNLSAVAAFVQFGNVPSSSCIYQNTYKLASGHFMKISLSDFESAKNTPQQKYWSVYSAYNKEKKEIDFETAKKETKDILQKAFEYRMVADVPLGVFLSGGYDSACVTAMLQKDRTEKLKTYTISVPDIGLNEAPYAKDVAQYLGTDHHEFACTQKEALDIIPELPHFYDEPFADSSAIPTTLLSKWVKQDVTVALSADAGDEIFAGYNRYDYLMRYGKKLNQIPSWMRSASVTLMDKIPAEKIPVLKNKYNFANRYEKMKGLLKDPSAEKMMWSLSTQYDDNQLQDLFVEPVSIGDTAYHSKELKAEYKTDLSYMLAIDYETYLVDDILQKVDRATMTASLEGREPFLDHNIIEYAASLPDNFKYRDGQKKFMLKEIVHDYIPKEMMERPKMGFAIPIENWMCNELRELAEDFLSDDRIQRQGLFKLKTIQEIKFKFFNGHKELGFKMWYLISFQMWHEKHMN